MIRAALAATTAICILLLPAVAGADPTDAFSASITPAAVQPAAVTGTYTIFVANQANSSPATQGTIDIPTGFVLDVAAAPSASIVSGPCSGHSWNVTPAQAQLTLAAPDDGSALCGRGTLAVSFSVESAPLVDGPYTWTTSLSGSSGTPFLALAQPTLVIDGMAPETTLNGSPASPSAPSVSFSFSGSDGTGSGVGGYQCSLDGGAFSACSSPKSYSGLLDGGHHFEVRAVDAAGNADPEPAFFDWTVDAVAPETTLDVFPPSLTSSRSAQLEFHGTDEGVSGVAGYQCALDGAGYASCSAPSSYSGLADGPHSFDVRAIDNVGNVDASPATASWTVDTVPPQTSIASGPPGSSQSASATFTFASSEAASTFTCRLDGAGFVPCASPTTYTGLGDGDHTFSVQAVDAAGNADATAATYAWRVSGVDPPKQDLQPPANVRNVRRSVGYGRLQLHWRNPSNSDFDHVAVFVATKRSTPPRTLVFSGRRQTYLNRRFKNGLYYRYLIVSYDHAENAAGGTPVTVAPNVLLKGAGDGRIVHAPPLLRWAAVRKATFYNVQVFHRGQKILSAWPAKARQKLGRRWVYGGRHVTLRAGIYAWYVWPAFGPRAGSRYGQLLGEGTFKLR